VQDGTPFGRYRLLELMGRGEMGETWRAFDTVTQRHVAVTVLPTQDVDDAVPRERFRQETVPAALPDDPAHAPQSGIIVEYPLYWPDGQFPTDPTHNQRTHDDPNPPGPKKSRKRRLIAFSSVAAIAVTVAVVAAVLLIGPSGHGGAPQASSTSGSPVPLANTGPFTGTFTVHMGAAQLGSGNPATNAEVMAYTETWHLRSACGANGCVATASAGDHSEVQDLVFDNVGGRWISVAISQINCGNPKDEEAWNVVSLVPQADGSMSGESTRASVDGCFIRRTATLTRTGDTDIAQLPDPALKDPRVVSPAEALHGRYDSQTTYANGHKTGVFKYGVRTDCLRTGDRCMSFFLTAGGYYEPQVFANGAWTLNEDMDDTCSSGGTYHATFTATMALPQPLQDPITSLVGHGYANVPAGVSCPSQAYDETYTRTGD
jgi:hypothetical protein